MLEATPELLAKFQPKTGFPHLLSYICTWDPEKTESIAYIWWYIESINSQFLGLDQWPLVFVHGGNYKLFICFPFLFFFRISCSYSISPKAHLSSLCLALSSPFQAPPLPLPSQCIDQSRVLRLEQLIPGFLRVLPCPQFLYSDSSTLFSQFPMSFF